MIDKIERALLSVLYPQQCVLCSEPIGRYGDGVACDQCWEATKFFYGDETVCLKCGLFLRDSEPLFDTYCHQCDDHHYDKARAVGVYKDALAAAIVHLKTTPILPKRLESKIAPAALNSFDEPPDLVIPVPLSKLRLKERGFNQASVVGKIVAKAFGVKLDEFSLTRTAHTKMHRAGMDVKARENSVKNAFAVSRPKLVTGKRVLLVDDILTSGATVSGCAKVLKKSGAVRVDVFTLARAAKFTELD